MGLEAIAARLEAIAREISDGFGGFGVVTQRTTFVPMCWMRRGFLTRAALDSLAFSELGRSITLWESIA